MHDLSIGLLYVILALHGGSVRQSLIPDRLCLYNNSHNEVPQWRNVKQKSLYSIYYFTPIVCRIWLCHTVRDIIAIPIPRPRVASFITTRLRFTTRASCSCCASKAKFCLTDMLLVCLVESAFLCSWFCWWCWFEWGCWLYWLVLVLLGLLIRLWPFSAVVIVSCCPGSPPVSLLVKTASRSCAVCSFGMTSFGKDEDVSPTPASTPNDVTCGIATRALSKMNRLYTDSPLRCVVLTQSTQQACLWCRSLHVPQNLDFVGCEVSVRYHEFWTKLLHTEMICAVNSKPLSLCRICAHQLKNNIWSFLKRQRPDNRMLSNKGSWYTLMPFKEPCGSDWIWMRSGWNTLEYSFYIVIMRPFWLPQMLLLL